MSLDKQLTNSQRKPCPPRVTVSCTDVSLPGQGEFPVFAVQSKSRRRKRTRRRLRVCWGNGWWTLLKPPAWSSFVPSPWPHCGWVSADVPRDRTFRLCCCLCCFTAANQGDESMSLLAGKQKKLLRSVELGGNCRVSDESLWICHHEQLLFNTDLSILQYVVHQHYSTPCIQQLLYIRIQV